MNIRIAVVLFLAGLTGCQCCRMTEPYQDMIDCIADHEGHMDRWYRPTWDLTRIGRDDWCESEFNRKWCGERCRCRTNPYSRNNAPITRASDLVAMERSEPLSPSVIPPAEPTLEPEPALPQSDATDRFEEVPSQLKAIPDPSELRVPDAQIEPSSETPRLIPPPVPQSFYEGKSDDGPAAKPSHSARTAAFTDDSASEFSIVTAAGASESEEMNETEKGQASFSSTPSSRQADVDFDADADVIADEKNAQRMKTEDKPAKQKETASRQTQQPKPMTRARPLPRMISQQQAEKLDQKQSSEEIVPDSAWQTK